MTREELIRMAREAGLQTVIAQTADALEHFAALVAAAEREHYEELFEHIKGWCEAYPISIFPEPDFGKAHEVLKANGMTLDAISASNMKHVITQVQKMIDDAIRARGQA